MLPRGPLSPSRRSSGSPLVARASSPWCEGHGQDARATGSGGRGSAGGHAREDVRAAPGQRLVGCSASTGGSPGMRPVLAEHPTPRLRGSSILLLKIRRTFPKKPIDLPGLGSIIRPAGNRRASRGVTGSVAWGFERCNEAPRDRSQRRDTGDDDLRQAYRGQSPQLPALHRPAHAHWQGHITPQCYHSWLDLRHPDPPRRGSPRVPEPPGLLDGPARAL